MAEIRNYQARVAAGTRTDAAIDEGLRAYMLKVYNLMALGLAITGVAAFGTMMLATTNDPAAAVATPWTSPFCLMIAPAPMKPMPVISPCITSDCSRLFSPVNSCWPRNTYTHAVIDTSGNTRSPTYACE